MYRYYNNIMEYKFNSIDEFIDYLDSNSTNLDIWKNKELSSYTGDYDFCKTRSLEEAKELCKYGYHDDFEKLIELKTSLEKYIKMSFKESQQYNYYVGYAPDVKAYLEGNPLSMFNRRLPERKHIDIYYNCTVSSETSTNQIYNRGAITLNLVEILENMRFSVGLNVFTMAVRNCQIHYAKFNLKRNGERLNAQKLYFPLCHPSFLRRLVFRLCEETPDITVPWTYGYGMICHDFTIRKILDLKENDIVICQPDEMGVRGNDIIEDANAMFDYIRKFTTDAVELQHIKRLKK